MMNVGELRKVLEGLPDDMPILTYDNGHIQEEFCGTDFVEGGDFRYPNGDRGKKYLLIY